MTTMRLRPNEVDALAQILRYQARVAEMTRAMPNVVALLDDIAGFLLPYGHTGASITIDEL